VFTCNTAVTSKHLLPGVDLKTLTWGERTLLAQFNIEEDRRIPNTTIRMNKSAIFWPDVFS
jgi:hypothetical protein